MQVAQLRTLLGQSLSNQAQEDRLTKLGKSMRASDGYVMLVPLSIAGTLS